MRLFGVQLPRCWHINLTQTSRWFSTNAKPVRRPYKSDSSSKKHDKNSFKSHKSKPNTGNVSESATKSNEITTAPTLTSLDVGAVSSAQETSKFITALIQSNRLKEAVHKFANARKYLPLETWNAILVLLTRQPELFKIMYPHFKQPSDAKPKHKRTTKSKKIAQTNDISSPIINPPSQQAVDGLQSSGPIGKAALSAEAVDKFMNDLASCRLVPNAETFKLLMDSASLSLDFESVVSLHGQMASLNIQPDRSTLHSTMNALIELKQYKAVREIFSKYFSQKDTTHSDVVVDAYSEELDTKELDGQSKVSNQSSQSTSLSAISQPASDQSIHVDSSQVLSDSQSLLEPDEFTYHLLLNALMAAGDSAAVYVQWKKLTTAFPYPKIDPSLISNFIHFLGTRGRIGEMIVEYENVIDAGVKPPFVMLSSAIQFLSSSIITGSVQQIVTGYGLTPIPTPPIARTTKGVHRSIDRSRKRSLTLERLLSHVAMYGYQMTHGLYMSTILAFAALGDAYQVVRLYNQFLQHYPDPPLLVRRALIAAHAATGDIQAMEGFYHQLCAAGHPNDELSLQAMIRGYAVAKKSDKMHKMIETWRSVVGPDAQLNEEVQESLKNFYQATGNVKALLSIVGDLKKASWDDRCLVIKAVCHSDDSDAVHCLFNMLKQLVPPLLPPLSLLNSIFTFIFMRAQSSDKRLILDLVKRLKVRWNDELTQQVCLCFCITDLSDKDGRKMSSRENILWHYFRSLRSAHNFPLTASHLAATIQHAVTLLRNHQPVRDRISTETLYSLWKFTRHYYQTHVQSSHYDAIFALLDYMGIDQPTAMVDAYMADEFGRMIRDGLEPSMNVSQLVLSSSLRNFDFAQFLQMYSSCYRAMLSTKDSAGTDPRIEFHSRGLSMIRNALSARQKNSAAVAVPTLAFSSCDIILTLLAQDLLRKSTKGAMIRQNTELIASAYENIAGIIIENSGVQSTDQPQDDSAVDLSAALLEAFHQGKTSSKQGQMRFVSIVSMKSEQSSDKKASVPREVKPPRKPKPGSKVRGAPPLADERLRIVIDHQGALQYFASVIVTIGNSRKKHQPSKAETERFLNAARDARQIARTLLIMPQ